MAGSFDFEAEVYEIHRLRARLNGMVAARELSGLQAMPVYGFLQKQEDALVRRKTAIGLSMRDQALTEWRMNHVIAPPKGL